MTKAHNIKQAVTHAPEPWEHRDNGLIYGQCRENDVEAPIVCDVIEDSAMQALGMLSPVEEANARRICAAVNACKGIGTEALEQGIIREMLVRLKTLLVQIDEDVPTDITTRHFAEAYDEASAALRAAVETGAKISSLPPPAPELPVPFDAYEIHGMKRLSPQGQEQEPIGRVINGCEQVSASEAQFWSLFGHIPGQGLDCIGDFATRQHAEEILARITGRPY